jgi:SAM-dependent methyltransferase
MRSLLKSILFNPIWITETRLFKYISEAISSVKIQPGEKWLDIGCGSRPYEKFFPSGTYIGVDVQDSGRPVSMKTPDYFYDGKKLPFVDGSMNGVLCTQVLEHVPDSDALISEINRVLRPGGMLILTAPFLWEEHEEPYDFFRFTSFGLRELLMLSGFDVITMQKTTGLLEAVAQILSVYVVNNLSLSIRGWSRLLSLFVCCPIQIVGLLLQRLLPDQKKLFLDCVIVARRKA